MPRPVTYPFAAMPVGAGFSVALNGRAQLAVWRSVAAAARQYRARHNSRFDWHITADSHWLHVERRPDAADRAARIGRPADGMAGRIARARAVIHRLRAVPNLAEAEASAVKRAEALLRATA